MRSLLARMRVGLRYKLDAALYDIQQQAKTAAPGRAGDIEAACKAAVRACGGSTIVIRIPASQLLALACDEMRSRGDSQAVSALERVVQAIKNGEHRHLTAQVNLAGVTSEGQLEQAFETLRHHLNIIGNR